MNAIAPTTDPRPQHAGGAPLAPAEPKAPATATPTAARHPTPPARPLPALRPPVDVLEDADGITLLADMPGVPRERLQLQVDGDELRIEGEMTLAVPPHLHLQHAEVRRAAYRRAFTLSKELDPERISAELTHGVLRVRIPKAAHAKPRRVAVQVA